MIEIKHRHTGAVLYTSGGESLRDAVMQAARDRAYLGFADLRGSDLRGSDLRDADLSCSDVRDADLSGSDLRGSDLSFADLRDVDLSGAYLSGSDLSFADLSGSDLSGSDLRGSDLRDADLSCSDVRDADLRDADLNGSDLTFADLRGSDLRGAYLRGNRLVGERPLLVIGPIGSRDDYLSAWLADAGVMVTAGCFHGTLDEFRAAVEATHGNNEHGREYAAAIAMIEAHAAVWAEPAVAEAA